MQIKIYFSDLKPEKQRELLPKLREFFDEEIPIPLVIFDTDVEIFNNDPIIRHLIQPNLYPPEYDYTGQEACERLEQEAQLRVENQDPEQETDDGEIPF
jgi:hypothetical protein